MGKKATAPIGWRVHTPNLLREIFTNVSPSGKAALHKPMQIFGELMFEVAERAIELNDPRLNQLMLRLTMYEQADPEAPGFDKRIYNYTGE